MVDIVKANDAMVDIFKHQNNAMVDIVKNKGAMVDFGQFLGLEACTLRQKYMHTYNGWQKKSDTAMPYRTWNASTQHTTLYRKYKDGLYINLEYKLSLYFGTQWYYLPFLLTMVKTRFEPHSRVGDKLLEFRVNFSSKNEKGLGRSAPTMHIRTQRLSFSETPRVKNYPGSSYGGTE